MELLGSKVCIYYKMVVPIKFPAALCDSAICFTFLLTLTRLPNFINSVAE